MREKTELKSILRRAEIFCDEARDILYKLRNIADEIERLLGSLPRIRISRKRKRVRRNNRDYYYDYIEISIENKTVYLPSSEERRISIIEKAARIRSNLLKILDTIYKL